MIYSKQSGTGEAVVLIHGFCETHEVWQNIIPALNKTNFVIAIDLPGFGKSSLPNSLNTIDEISEEVYLHLISQGITQCVMIGHSLGGYVTLSIAKHHPQFLKRFGLFHSTSFADPEDKKVNREKSMSFIKKYGVEPFTNAFVPTLFADSENPYIHSLLIKAAQCKLYTILKYTEAMKNRNDRTDVLKNFARPILIIAGTLDQAVPFENSMEESKLVKHLTFKKLNDIGHMGMYECPEIVSDILKEFV